MSENILSLRNNHFFIGIDPGSVSLGYAILSLSSRLNLIKSGVLCFSSHSSLGDKLLSFYNFLVQIFSDLTSSDGTISIAIEQPFFFKNVHSTFVLNSFYSIALLFSFQQKICFISFSPCEIKKIISGYGGARKSDVEAFIRVYFPFVSSFSSADESDAIAIAIAASLKKH
jgi:crossover junction endodeoxyribonuclease RuvC